MSQYYWETIADQLQQEGWSYGYAKVTTSKGTVWNVDAYKRDGVRRIAEGETLMLAFCAMEKVLTKKSGQDDPPSPSA